MYTELSMQNTSIKLLQLLVGSDMSPGCSLENVGEILMVSCETRRIDYKKSISEDPY
jgi:hypothetical protein